MLSFGLWQVRVGGSRRAREIFLYVWDPGVLQEKRGEKRKQHMLSLSRARVVRRKVAVESERIDVISTRRGDRLPTFQRDARVSCCDDRIWKCEDRREQDAADARFDPQATATASWSAREGFSLARAAWASLRAARHRETSRLTNAKVAHPPRKLRTIATGSTHAGWTSRIKGADSVRVAMSTI